MDEKLSALIAAAISARENAYAPYSEFRVGAALLTADGEQYTGANVENGSYGMTVCAERIAIFKAVTEGKRQFSEIVVATDTEEPTPPCGACLQVMRQFASDLRVHLVTVSGRLESYSLQELLPRGFTDSHLKGCR